MANYELPVLCMCADLVRSIKLRRDFDTDPFAIMTAYGLDNEAMEAFYTMFSALPGGGNQGTWKAISDYMWDKEISNFVVEKLFPLPSDQDCQLPVAYPNPSPGLYTFAPATAAHGTNNVVVTVKGMGLWKNTEVFLKKGGNEYKVLSGTPVGTYRCSHLVGAFDLTTVPAGNYKLFARNVTVKAAYEREYEHGTQFVVT